MRGHLNMLIRGSCCESSVLSMPEIFVFRKKNTLTGSKQQSGLEPRQPSLGPEAYQGVLLLLYGGLARFGSSAVIVLMIR